jgi:hypothetical protein
MNMSGYIEPIAIVFEFCKGLNTTTQDRITESGIDRPCNSDIDSWLKAAC